MFFAVSRDSGHVSGFWSDTLQQALCLRICFEAGEKWRERLNQAAIWGTKSAQR